MASTTTPAPTASNGSAAAPTSAASGSLPVDAISYEDLYARWERGNWSAMDLDFTEDARQWREQFTDFERKAALWNYSLFFWGEDAVADNLSPYIDAAPREEQKYFLTTQQVDEARHAVFFKRFMQEVCGIGDGSMDSGLRAIKPQLTPGFRKIFDRLDQMADELRADRSPAQLAAAVTLYHIVIEAALAQPGQHFICSYLEKRDQLPAFRQGMQNIAADEQRHIGFGVKLLSDLKREDPVGVPKAVARILHDVTRYTAQVLMPPGWDESYITVFGATYDEVGVEGLTSMTTKLRSAGLGAETLPGPALLPPGLSPLEVSQRGRALAQAGVIGVREGPTKR
ncbi:MAG: ribonucleotide-diphosphate reductase subunit beta, partial [Solirubrobacteraceae bacterium]